MGWLFRFLFKYPAFVFQQGDFAFATFEKNGSIRRRHAHGRPRVHRRRRDQKLLKKAVANDHSDFFVRHSLLREELRIRLLAELAEIHH